MAKVYIVLYSVYCQCESSPVVPYRLPTTIQRSHGKVPQKPVEPTTPQNPSRKREGLGERSSNDNE